LKIALNNDGVSIRFKYSCQYSKKMTQTHSCKLILADAILLTPLLKKNKDNFFSNHTRYKMTNNSKRCRNHVTQYLVQAATSESSKFIIASKWICGLETKQLQLNGQQMMPYNESNVYCSQRKKKTLFSN